MISPLRSFLCQGVLVAVVLAGVARGDDLAIRLPALPAGTRVVFEVYTSADSFAGLRLPAQREVTEITGTNVFRLANPPAGEYALLAYVDENRNDRLDRNFLGIPVEPVGFPNGYRPKGPPLYSRAVVAAAGDTTSAIDIDFRRPLGKRGQLGVGLGVIAQSSPYRDADGAVYQVIPAIAYIGERLQILGPFAQYGLVSGRHAKLAVRAGYRMGAYEENDSPILQGLGDRKDTLALGLALQGNLPAGFDVSAGYEHDALDRAGGGTAQLGLDRGFQWRRIGITPGVTLHWLSADQANYDFGVPADKATVDRPAYHLDESLSIEAQLSTFIEITDNMRVFVAAGVEFIDENVQNSPIVDEDRILHAFAAVTYAL